MTKECGSCTMCCKLLGIQELSKPQGKWCQHCNIGKGCRIYDTKPGSCTEYECLYLMVHDLGKDPPLEMRPDKSKCVITSGDDAIVVHVDPAYPDAWQREPVYGYLLNFAAGGLRVIIGIGTGNKKIMLYKKGGGIVGKKTITMSDPDKDGMQWVEMEVDEQS